MRAQTLLLSALLVLGLGCGDDGSSEPAGDGDGDHHEHDGDVPFEPAECPDDLPDFVIGLEAMGKAQLIKGELIDADKIPVGWYHNDWVVKFTGPEGEALEDIAIDRAYTFMRVHGHDGGTDPTHEDLGDGEFAFDGLNVSMAGPWEFTFKVSAQGADGEAISDDVIFYVCNSQPKPGSD